MGTATGARLGEFGILLQGARLETGATFDVRSPYDGALVATVHNAGPAQIERAIAAAAHAFATTRRLPVVEARRGAGVGGVGGRAAPRRVR